MFWWLSFLRPPPSDAHGHLDVILQVTNDLRTESVHARVSFTSLEHHFTGFIQTL